MKLTPQQWETVAWAHAAAEAEWLSPAARGMAVAKQTGRTREGVRQVEAKYRRWVRQEESRGTDRKRPPLV